MKNYITVRACLHRKFGTSGVKLGIKISRQDLDRYFDKSWKTILLSLSDGNKIEIDIIRNYLLTSKCSSRQILHREIGAWLKEEGLFPWEHGNPPKLKLTTEKEGEFELSVF